MPAVPPSSDPLGTYSPERRSPSSDPLAGPPDPSSDPLGISSSLHRRPSTSFRPKLATIPASTATPSSPNDDSTPARASRPAKRLKRKESDQPWIDVPPAPAGHYQMHNSESDEDSEIKKTSRREGGAQRQDLGEGGSRGGNSYQPRGRPKPQYEYKEDDESEEDDDENDGDVASDDMASEDGESYGGSKRKPRKPVVESTRASSRIKIKKQHEPEESESGEEEEEISTPKATRSRTRNGDDDEDPESSSAALAASNLKRPKIIIKRPPQQELREEGDEVDELGSEEGDEIDQVLDAHRDICEKCLLPPADGLLEAYQKKQAKNKGKGRKKRRSSDSDDDAMSENESIMDMGGWLLCKTCCVVAHFGCVSDRQRQTLKREIAKDSNGERKNLEVGEDHWFTCGKCELSPTCFSCGEEGKITSPSVPIEPSDSSLTPAYPPVAQPFADPAIAPSGPLPSTSNPPSLSSLIQKSYATSVGGRTDGDGDVEMGSTEGSMVAKVEGDEIVAPPMMTEEERELLFRCIRCKRGVHYHHLRKPIGWKGPATAAGLGEFYQDSGWQCHDCVRWTDDVDKVIAWRLYPENAIDPTPPGKVADYKAVLPREYLVKWSTQGFRHAEWVPHLFLTANAPQKLRNFLKSGSQLDLLVLDPTGEGASEGPGEASVASVLELDPQSDRRATALAKTQKEAAIFSSGAPVADGDAMSRLPTAWMTFDRVMDAFVRVPAKKEGKGKGKARMAVNDEEEELHEDEAVLQGVKPADEDMMHIDDWEKKTGRKADESTAGLIVWCFAKWGDLPYSQSTWDTPPPRSDPVQYSAYLKAFNSFLLGRQVVIPVLTAAEANRRDSRRLKDFKELKQQPDCVVGGTLMPFQLAGLNWLFYKWWSLHPCILADDMGLGKTIQIASLVGLLGSREHHIYPSLIVVPNSTITNWVRELEKWVPHIRVVPYHGQKESRDVIGKYELFHVGTRSKKGLKAHCVLTTYDIITSKSFDVFSSVPRWELLIVDEGQRLKSDSNKIFQRLKSLNTRHRVLLTGTPLNNNIRELFNLMNFLDPETWSDLPKLVEQFENLDKENLSQLHEKLQPYFLRRVKAEVLQLPPKHEIIVPISMKLLQKEIYKSLMLQNLSMLQGLIAQPSGPSATKKMTHVKKSNLNNLMMQLRKTCQHPYLVSQDLEDQTVDLQVAHQRMTEGSAKLAMLKMMLPKLKERGHRVLLFSQFKIALDILQDWLDGEGLTYIRLDGDTPQAQRQKDMDRFNAPNSDLFLYLLSTRAGGVGINLASADTVIVFDPDFNPHQDLQAIARAYRFGQKKKVLVFKFMIKDSVEEKIFQKGKKKMVLDHLIVQNMANEEDTDVQSMITFGAKALFESTEVNEIHYTPQDVDDLITRVENTADNEDRAGDHKEGMSFGFAKIWEASHAAENADDEDKPVEGEAYFWEEIVKRAAEEKEKEQEKMGRGAKRTRNQKGTYAEPQESPSKGPRGNSSSPYDSDAIDDSDLSDDSNFGNSPPPRPSTSSVGDLAEVAPKKKVSTTVKPKEIIRTMAALCRNLELNLEMTLHEACAKTTPLPSRIELYDRVSTLLIAALHLRDLPSPFSQHTKAIHRYLQGLPFEPYMPSTASSSSSVPPPASTPTRSIEPTLGVPITSPLTSSPKSIPAAALTVDSNGASLSSAANGKVSNLTASAAAPEASNASASSSKRDSPDLTTAISIESPVKQPKTFVQPPAPEGICEFCLAPNHARLGDCSALFTSTSTAKTLKRLGKAHPSYKVLKEKGSRRWGAALLKAMAVEGL